MIDIVALVLLCVFSVVPLILMYFCFIKTFVRLFDERSKKDE